MFCSKCGAENPEAARFCAKCGNALALAPAAPVAAPPLDTMRASGATVPVSPTGKTPWVAALLSFLICGLGQLYNNDVKKGVTMFVAAIAGVWLTAGVVTFFIWIWGIVDGWQVAAGKMKPWS